MDICRWYFVGGVTPSLLVSSVLQNTGKAYAVFPSSKAFLCEICQTKIPRTLLIHYHTEKSSTPRSHF